MTNVATSQRTQLALIALILSLVTLPRVARAHCDTMDGPVVKAAQQALAASDVTPALKWVKPEYEEQVKAAFDKTLAVRKLNEAARDLADMYFFETLVRLHRAGEGEPYTGLKPAGTDPGPAVKAADQALESGSVDALVKLTSDAVATGLREQFAAAAQSRKTSERSVADGRAFVATYVEFVHYAERLYEAARATGRAHVESGDAEPLPGDKSHAEVDAPTPPPHTHDRSAKG